MIKINMERPSLEILRDGEPSTWHYDVITLKLEVERLEILHDLKEGKRIKRPTSEFLQDFADYLAKQGLEGCSIDIAMRVYSLVTVQFNQLSRSIAAQVAELGK